MKKILSIVVLLFMSAMIVYSQEKDVTQFLGIPVDGTKAEMIKKLKAKGFQYNRTLDVLEGEFNGANVTVSIMTHKNKVWRICLVDKNAMKEGDIILRFNSLCYQFNRNRRYLSVYQNYIIPDDEDISYEMSVNNKRYEAIFLQRTSDSESDVDDHLLRIRYMLSTYKKVVWFVIIEFYGKYYIGMCYDNEYNKVDGEDL